MKREVITLLVWLLVSVFVCIESWRLGLGSLRMPGSGFLPFGVSLLVATLAVVLLVGEWKEKPGVDVKPLFQGVRAQNIILGFAFLLAYPLLLSQVGFFLCSLLFTLACLRVIGEKKWLFSLGVSLTVSIVAYVVFDVWLANQLPKGVLMEKALLIGGKLWR